MIDFVGAGPGAADLITVRGMRLIEEADVIIYAGSLVNPDLVRGYAKRDAKIFNSAKMTLEEIIDVMREEHAAGKRVVRVHTGDPSLYGAIKEQMDALQALDIPYRTTPGVSACFGAASELNLEYTLPDVTQTLILTRMGGVTKVPEAERIEELARHHASMAIYLSAGMLPKVQQALLDGGYGADTPAMLAYKATWADQAYYPCTVSTIAQTGEQHGITKTALVLVGDVLSCDAKRSKLYDPAFTTGFRTSKSLEEADNE